MKIILNKESGECELKADCSSLTCTADKMIVKLKSGILGEENSEKLQTIGGLTPKDSSEDGFDKMISCDLEDSSGCGLTHNIQDDS